MKYDIMSMCLMLPDNKLNMILCWPDDRIGPLYPRHIAQGDQKLSILGGGGSFPFSIILITGLNMYEDLCFALNMALVVAYTA